VTQDALIVDVGMSDGTDTEFYLKKGFRVLAIEANPRCVEQVTQRLPGAIDEGRLTIAHVAVADHKGEVEFLISDREGWGSLEDSDVVSRGAALGVGTTKITVPCDTFDSILDGHGDPYFVKVDIEGGDILCIQALGRLPRLPRYVSFECDTVNPDQTLAMLDLVQGFGYSRYKLLNQALNPTLRCPNPPREGAYVDAMFSTHSSGPFGEETPGEWVSVDGVRDKFLSVARQQALRATYSSTGKVLGIPLGRFHKQLEWAYNVAPVKAARTRWASWRGVEMGGWFDIHAAL
jgi:FkbM family methyltransferase